MNDQNETMETAPEEFTSNESTGIDDVKPMVNLVAELANVSGEIVKGNYGSLMRLIDEVAALEGVDFDKFLIQLKDVDTDESKELASIFKKKFDIDNDSLELVIEQALDSVEKTYLAIMSWVNLSKRIKSLED